MWDWNFFDESIDHNCKRREYMTLIAGIDAETRKVLPYMKTMDLFMQGRLKRLVISLING